MKTKALISFAVTAKLICAFDFAYADCWFSHAVAHIQVLLVHNLVSGILHCLCNLPKSLAFNIKKILHTVLCFRFTGSVFSTRL